MRFPFGRFHRVDPSANAVDVAVLRVIAGVAVVGIVAFAAVVAATGVAATEVAAGSPAVTTPDGSPTSSAATTPPATVPSPTATPPTAAAPAAIPLPPASNGSHGSNTSKTTGPEILELYPNPVTEGNRGEYLVVQLPSSGNWSLSDGYHETAIPPTANGTVALSMEPEATETHFLESEIPIHALEGYFPLAADGDRIKLRNDGEVVDVVEYGRVREGYRWHAEWSEWRPDGYEPRSPTSLSDTAVTPFVLPDSPSVPVEPLRTADERVLLAGYTVESDRVVDRLIAAHERGVEVRVLIEGTPVGGFPEQGAHAADRLDAAGIEVRVLDGEPDRFRFHHAKYAVADDRAVVLTENWKESGTGGDSNRGWGVVADDDAVAAELATLFENDAAGDDTRDWSVFREDATFHEPPSVPSGGSDGDRETAYPSRFDPPTPAPADVELLTAPGNAADRIVARIDAADNRVLAVVPRTGGPDERIVRALRRAADRGVDTHLLLSGAWYDRDENRDLAETLAAEPIEVAVADPRGRYGTVHAKGLVIDDTAVVGSLNWNEQAATENREVLLAVESPAVADFYARTYAADWRGGGIHLPVGLVGGLLASLVGAGVVARREVTFV